MKSSPPKHRARARDLGIPFDGVAGPLNAITDVAGVEVGHATIIRGHGARSVRTGVTAILPRGRRDLSPCFAACHVLNGNGEMTGTAWIEESGWLTSPILITNTHSVGVVRDAVIAWRLRRGPMIQPWMMPVVGETWDGFLNDTNGFHVKASHASAALDGARPGRVAEGCAGGGTGMIGYGFKGGIGTASRRIDRAADGWTLGVLVQLNCGRMHELMIAGRAVGRMLSPTPRAGAKPERGSIIIVAATDAPLLPHQLKRIARRLTMGLARTGSVSGNGSGDLFLAFSTARATPAGNARTVTTRMVPEGRIDPLFTATVQACEEAIVNALVAAESMTGLNGRSIEAIPHDRLREIFGTKF
jgi:D-aminopeptidase